VVHNEHQEDREGAQPVQRQGESLGRVATLDLRRGRGIAPVLAATPPRSQQARVSPSGLSEAPDSTLSPICQSALSD